MILGCIALIILGIIYFVWKYPDLRKAWFFWPRTGFVAIMYHHIKEEPSDNPADYAFAISPTVFEQQLQYMHEHGFTPISTEQLFHAKQTGHKHVEKPVLLTFDDATDDHYVHLFPLLKKHHTPALIFIITDWVGTPGYMTWDQIREMQQSGLVEFGSHTCSHRRLRSLTQDEIIYEITQSKKIIEEQLGCPARTFCYPFGAGAFDKHVRPHVFEAGYLADFSTKHGINPWPWRGKSTILRIFPRGRETWWDFHLELTRGRSRL